jgi:membrane protease YdiL (CAAX protease family)
MSRVRRMLGLSFVQVAVEVVAAGLLLGLSHEAFVAQRRPAYPAEGFDLVENVLSAALLLGLLVLAARLLERRPLAEIGIARPGAVRAGLLGFAGGAAMFAAVVGILAVAGWYRVTGVEPLARLLRLLLPWLALIVATAAVEEFLFRGILFRLAERALGSWLAVLLSAVLFGLSHMSTAHATVVGALAIAVGGGVVMAALFVLTRSLWPVIGLHAGWNFCEGPLFGAPISGYLNFPSLLHPSIAGPASWTGGAYGPEAGLLPIIVGLTVSAALFALAVRRGRLVAPPRRWWVRRAWPAPPTVGA